MTFRLKLNLEAFNLTASDEMKYMQFYICCLEVFGSGLLNFSHVT
jgi:hypothetical protein